MLDCGYFCLVGFLLGVTFCCVLLALRDLKAEGEICRKQTEQDGDKTVGNKKDPNK